jgi:IS30 family transposase
VCLNIGGLVIAHNQHLTKQLNKGNILKIETNKPLKEYIIEKLKEDWSPEEISGRIQLFHSDPDFDSYIKYVCHETIYNFIYSEKSKKLRLPALLRRHKKKRTKWYSRGKK